MAKDIITSGFRQLVSDRQLGMTIDALKGIVGWIISTHSSSAGTEEKMTNTPAQTAASHGKNTTILQPG